MADHKIEELLEELAIRSSEPAPQGLVETIKRQIPDRLMTPRWGKDTVNIIVHLKISRVAAVAAIVISLIVFGDFFGSGASLGDSWYQDIKGTVNDLLNRSNGPGPNLAKVYQELAENGAEVVYYGGNANSQDETLVLMHWRLPEGDYRVIFSNGRVTRFSAEQLIATQARMIRDMQPQR